MIVSSWKGNHGGKKHYKLGLLVITVIKKNVGLNCIDNLLIQHIIKQTRHEYEWSVGIHDPCGTDIKGD